MLFLKVFLARICRNKFLLAALSGLLTALPLIWPALYPLAFFSMIPLALALMQFKRGKGGFLVMLCYGMVFYFVAYSWFLYLHPLDWMGIPNDKSLPAVMLIWFVVCLLHSLVAAFFAMFFVKIKTGGVWDIFLFPALYVLMEALQTVSAFAFPWARLAVSMHSFLPFLQSADFLGSLFVTFLTVLINFMLGYPIYAMLSSDKTSTLHVSDKKHMQTIRSRKRAAAWALAAVLVFSANLLYGELSIHRKDNTNGQTFIAAAIQGNFSPNQKWEQGIQGSEIFDEYLSLSQSAADNGATLILWPETTIATELYEGHSYDLQLSDFAQQNGVTLVVGCFILHEDETRTNSLVMYSPDGNSPFSAIYSKRHVVPFGEYVPYSKYFNWFFSFFPGLNMKGNIVPGDSSVIFDSDVGNLSPLICFDSVFSKFAREAVNGGAQVLLLGTYDSYYRNSANPYQHSAHAVLRAIESGRYLVRASNTGVSSVISPTGKYIDYLQLYQTGYVSAEITALDSHTLYSVVGDIIVYICAAYVLLCTIMTTVRTQRDKKVQKKLPQQMS